MCRWMVSHFHDWIDYNGIFNSYEDGLTHSRDFGVRKVFMSKRTGMFVLQVKSKVASFNLKNGSIHFKMTYLKDWSGKYMTKLGSRKLQISGRGL